MLPDDAGDRDDHDDEADDRDSVLFAGGVLGVEPRGADRRTKLIGLCGIAIVVVILVVTIVLVRLIDTDPGGPASPADAARHWLNPILAGHPPPAPSPDCTGPDATSIFGARIGEQPHVGRTTTRATAHEHWKVTATVVPATVPRTPDLVIYVERHHGRYQVC